ncbi:MAG TPA: T9SS type A sorting domain-containing protein, partial [Mucilaginibacter sp.]|nr:T9SS type A sorting domain-containing protein [Mucilaginibacter sp.]
PAFTGTATLVIPAGLTNYPSLTADVSIYGLTIATGANLDLNGHVLSVACNIYNNGTGKINWNSNTASGLTWNGSLAAQSYTAGASTATGNLGSMTINNSAAGTITISNGPVHIYNQLTITKGNLVVGSSPAALTLKSTATLTASVNAIPAAYSITGTVNVERFLTGGSGYRGYRFLSSPVYGSTDSYANKIYSINYLINTCYLTGTTGPTGGFDKAGNPTLYLYRENMTPSNTTFTSGNFRGINTIGTAPNYNYLIDGDAGTFNIPVGNGFLFFFRGDRTAATLTAETTTTYVPTNATLTASGTLIQGQVVAKDWYTPNSIYLGYTGSGVTGNYLARGFNLVGNPYASSIDWETYNTTTTTSGIYANNVGTTAYELNPATKNFDSYQKGGASTNKGSRIIVSGQGFFVQASNSSNPQLIFNETAKVTTQNTGLFLFMNTKGNNAKANSGNNNQYLRLQLAKDSINTDDIYVGFNNSYKSEYIFNEDAEYKTGSGVVSLASFSADNLPLAINKLPLPKRSETIGLRVKAVADGIYSLTMTEQQGIPKLFQIWLIDHYKKDSLDIKHNPTYKFNVLRSDTNSYGSKRFCLVIRQDPALGVHLLDFAAAKSQGKVELTWKTENEENYTRFTIERSTDNGATFMVVGGFLSSADGTYTLSDKNPSLLTDQYRLKIEDLNGTISYSKVITIMYSALSSNMTSNLLNVYPNPAKSVVNLSIIPNSRSGSVSLKNTALAVVPADNILYNIQIVNNSGVIVKATTTTSKDWHADVTGFTPGTYVIQVINNTDKSLVGRTKFTKL